MKNILTKLAGGDLRSIGNVNSVVREVLNNPSLFKDVFNGLSNNDPVIKMRSADAIEKITSKHPEYLHPFKKRLICQIAKIEQQEVRWHLAQIFPRLRITPKEKGEVVRILFDYLEDKSKIVKTFSMQALSDLAEKDIVLRSRVINSLKKLIKTGSPAMKSRGKKLLIKLNKVNEMT